MSEDQAQNHLRSGTLEEQAGIEQRKSAAQMDSIDLPHPTASSLTQLEANTEKQ